MFEDRIGPSNQISEYPCPQGRNRETKSVPRIPPTIVLRRAAEADVGGLVVAAVAVVSCQFVWAFLGDVAVAPGDEGLAIEAKMHAGLKGSCGFPARIDRLPRLSEGVFLDAVTFREGSGGEHEGATGIANIRRSVGLKGGTGQASDVGGVVAVTAGPIFPRSLAGEMAGKLGANPDPTAKAKIVGKETFNGIERGTHTCAPAMPTDVVGRITRGAVGLKI